MAGSGGPIGHASGPGRIAVRARRSALGASPTANPVGAREQGVCAASACAVRVRRRCFFASRACSSAGGPGLPASIECPHAAEGTHQPIGRRRSMRVRQIHPKVLRAFYQQQEGAGLSLTYLHHDTRSGQVKEGRRYGSLTQGHRPDVGQAAARRSRTCPAPARAGPDVTCGGVL
jgi:hypothetical protein